MSAEIKASIAKLNGENYFTWKFKVDMLLIKEGVWDVLSSEKPEKGAGSWIRNDNIARATISLSAEDDQLITSYKAMQYSGKNLAESTKLPRKKDIKQQSKRDEADLQHEIR